MIHEEWKLEVELDLREEYEESIDFNYSCNKQAREEEKDLEFVALMDYLALREVTIKEEQDLCECDRFHDIHLHNNMCDD